MPQDNRLKEAFIQDANLIGLAAVVCASAVQLNPLPLLAGVVVETAYLLFAPDSAWIRSKIARKNRAADEAQRGAARAAAIAALREDMRVRFERLAGRFRDIRAAAGADPAWETTDLLPSLDYLLDKFLDFAGKEGRYRDYLQALRNEEPTRPVRSSQRVPPVQTVPDGDAVISWTNRLVEEVSARYAGELERIKADAEREKDPDARAILEKREQVLQERGDYLQRAARAIVNIHRQLTLLEDAFGLINDQVSARPPDQIKTDLDGVLQTTQMMTRTLDEMAQFEQSLSLGARG